MIVPASEISKIKALRIAIEPFLPPPKLSEKLYSMVKCPPRTGPGDATWVSKDLLRQLADEAKILEEK